MRPTFPFVFVLLATWLGAVPAHAKLEIVATVPDLAAIAREVGGEHVNVVSIANGREDPHYVDARPSHIVSLHRADLLLAIGLELEVGWLPALLRQARNPRIGVGSPGFVETSRFITPLEVPTTRVDRSMGDVHAGGNPHFTYDPRQGAIIARALATRLSELDAGHAEAYRSRAEEFARRAEALATRIAEKFATLDAGRRRIVTYHRSLTYLLDWLGLTAVATIEPKPGVSPNPSHGASVLATAKQQGARAIVQEHHYPTSTSETLAKLASAELVVIDSGTDLGRGETYLEHVEHIAEQLHAALAR